MHTFSTESLILQFDKFSLYLTMWISFKKIINLDFGGFNGYTYFMYDLNYIKFKTEPF